MRTQATAAAFAGLASVAAANLGNAVRARDAALEGRQEMSDECTSGLLSLAEAMPTPANSELYTSFLMITATPTATSDPCAGVKAIESELPESLHDEWSSYESQLYDWYQTQSDNVVTVVTQCAEGAPDASITAFTEALQEFENSDCLSQGDGDGAAPAGLLTSAAVATGAMVAGFVGLIAML